MSGTFLDQPNTIADNRNGVSWKQFISSISVGGILFVLQFSIFQYLRSRPAFHRIFVPKAYLVPEKQKTDPPDRSPIKWLYGIVTHSDQLIIQKCGLDSYLFTRYLWMLLKIFVPAMIVILPTLLPINAVGGQNGAGNVAGLDQLAWGNIKPEHSSRYWAHLVMAVILIIYCCAVFYDELLNFIKIRQAYLTSPQHRIRASAKTIFVPNISPRFRSVKALDELFDVFPDGIRKIWLNRNYQKLVDVVDRRDNFARQLEEAYTDLIRNANLKHKDKPERILETENEALWAKYLETSNRPTMHIPRWRGVRGLRMVPFWLLWIFGFYKSVDQIDHCTTELDRLGKKIDRYLQNPEQFEASNSAFIQFNSQVAAHMACQATTHHSPDFMTPRTLEIAPTDVVWDNMSVSWWEHWLRTAVFLVLFAGIILLWGIPVTFAGFLSSLDSIGSHIRWLGWLNRLPDWAISVFQGVVPQALVSLLITVLMPLLFRWLCKLTGPPTHAAVELTLQGWYFAFVFIELVLVVSISSGIFSTLSEILNDPLSVPQTLAENLPKASNFFFSYAILQAFSISSANLMQIGRLINMGWRKMFSYTPRSEFLNKTSCPRNRWGSFFPLYTNFAVIGLIYSIVAPLILVFVSIMFALFYIVFRNNNLYVFKNDVDTGGLLFAKAVYQLFTGLYFLEIVLIGLFFLVRDSNDELATKAQGIIMIVVLVLTAGFQYVIYSKLHPLIHYLPITLEDEAVERDKAFHEKILTRKSLSENVRPGEKTDECDKAGDFEMSDLRPSTSSADTKRPSTKAHSHTPMRRSTADTEKQSDNYHDMADLVGGFDDELEDLTLLERDALVDEAFTNPVLRARNCCIWIPQDDLGIAEDEQKRLAVYRDSFSVSVEGARLQGPKMKVNISGIPPDFEKTWIVEKEL